MHGWGSQVPGRGAVSPGEDGNATVVVDRGVAWWGAPLHREQDKIKSGRQHMRCRPPQPAAADARPAAVATKCHAACTAKPPGRADALPGSRNPATRGALLPAALSGPPPPPRPAGPARRRPLSGPCPQRRAPLPCSHTHTRCKGEGGRVLRWACRASESGREAGGQRCVQVASRQGRQPRRGKQPGGRAQRLLPLAAPPLTGRWGSCSSRRRSP